MTGTSSDTVLLASRTPFDIDGCTAIVEKLAGELVAAGNLDHAIRCVLAWDEAMAAQQTWSAAV